VTVIYSKWKLYSGFSVIFYTFRPGVVQKRKLWVKLCCWHDTAHPCYADRPAIFSQIMRKRVSLT